MEEGIFNPRFQNEDTSKKVVAGLERISEAFRVLLWDHAKVIGLSPLQIQILLFLKHHELGLCNVSYLAQEFNLSKPTISEAIRTLLKKQLIEKQQSDMDRRAYSLEINAEGEQIVAQAEHYASPFLDLVHQLDSEKLDLFFDSIMELVAGLHRIGVTQVQRACFFCQYYDKSEGSPYCKLLEKKLEKPDIRLDCPEFKKKD